MASTIPTWRLRRARVSSYLLGDRRIGVRTFFGHVAALLALSQAVGAFSPYLQHILVLWLPILILPDAAARLHDSGRSGWWAIVPAALLAALQRLDDLPPLPHPLWKIGLALVLIGWGLAAVRLLIRSGDVGRNAFGPDPRGDKI